MAERLDVYLNQFPVRTLSSNDKTVWRYAVHFDTFPEPDRIQTEISRVLWNLRTPGTRFSTDILTRTALTPEQLRGSQWRLEPLAQQTLDPTLTEERQALEQLERRWLEQQLRQDNSRRVERSKQGGLIWWNTQKLEHAGEGWQVHSGVQLYVVVNRDSQLSLEIDNHFRFYTSWTLQAWLDNHPEVPLEYVHNTYDDNSWKLVRVSEEAPEEVLLPELGTNLAAYHRQKGATESELQASRVVYVKKAAYSRQNREVAHLASRLRPSISMEVLSFLAEQGQDEASQVFSGLRQSVSERLDKGSQVANWLVSQIYRVKEAKVAPQMVEGFRFADEALLIQTGTAARPEVVLRRGCYRTGELRFGCLDLVGTGAWDSLVKQQLQGVAAASGVTLDLATVRTRQDLPERDLAKRQFWANLAQDGVLTMLVVTPWLGNEAKTRLRRDALQAGIALQFMLPMLRPDKYRATNVTLGLLVKAGWQPVGIQMPKHAKTADLTIGFDAGTNRDLFYGTSAFAVLTDGQSLGWEIPEAQSGERFSGEAIWQAVSSIVARFEQKLGRKPQRLLLLRDGLVQAHEFDQTIQELTAEAISVDLLEVHKSGGGRMAVFNSNQVFVDAPPGVAVSASFPDDTFRLITTQARAGGSARPLEIVRVHGDAPLPLLAAEVFCLSQFHPASGFIPSRLPMPLHYADRMIKEVQRLGQLSVLYGVDRSKIFAA